MRNMFYILTTLALMITTSCADAGWYEVKNYIGTIGSASVHVSLQTYDSYREEPAHSKVDGSYYYDAYRIPIPLQGQRQLDGGIVLCEATQPQSDAEAPLVPKASKTHPVPCPITLRFTDDNATGEWRDGKMGYDEVIDIE